MSVRDGGYASFQECSFSGNTAVNEVSSFLLNLLIDLFVMFCFLGDLTAGALRTPASGLLIFLFFCFSVFPGWSHSCCPENSRGLDSLFVMFFCFSCFSVFPG